MKKKVLVRGPALTRSGYGVHTRFVLRALREYEDRFDIFLITTKWGECAWLSADDEERDYIDQTLGKTLVFMQNGGQFDISVQVTIPNEFQKMAPVNIGVTAGIESTKIAPQWIQKCNEMDKIVTISNFAKDVMKNTKIDLQNQQTEEVIKGYGITTPIDIVSFPADLHEPVDIDLQFETDFNFLAVAQWGPRKNMENTVRWFVEEFFDDDNVGLVLKTSHRGNSVMDRCSITNGLRELLQEYEERSCKVYLIHGDMSDNEMSALYTHEQIKALVNIAHGECWGLPMFEATMHKLPVIACGWGGQCDYLYKKKTLVRKVKKKKRKFVKMAPYFAEVDYDIAQIMPQAVWSGVLEKDSQWCYAKEHSYRNALQKVYKNHERYVELASELSEHVREEYESTKQLDLMADCVYTPSEEEYNWGQDLSEVSIG